MTVASALLAHARRDPARRALTVGEDAVRYDQLASGIEACAGWLRRRCPGEARVGMLLPPGRSFLEVFLGAGQAGMAGMVLHPGWSGPELRHALATGRPDLVATTAGMAQRFRDELVGSPVVMVDRLGELVPDGPGGPDEPGVRAPDDGRAFYIGFTSGTTGGPRAFVRDHGSWMRSFDACRVFGIVAADEVAVPGDLAHSLFLFATLHALSEGAGVHLQPRFEAASLARSLHTAPITRLYVVPAMLGALLGTTESAPVSVSATASASAPSRLRSLISSGAPWPTPLLERVQARFPGAEVIDFYGSSETSFVSYRRVRAGDPPGDLGTPFPGVELRIADDPGRLAVRSDMLFSGYLEAGRLDARATASVRDADGFVSTGDVVTIDRATGDRADGDGGDREPRLRLVGRAGTMLICGGANVYPEQVERVLEDHPDVREAVVVGLPDPRWGEVPCAILRFAGSNRPSRGMLRVHCRERLSGAARPRRFLVTDVLPRTANEKPDRPLLAAQVADGTLVSELLR